MTNFKPVPLDPSEVAAYVRCIESICDVRDMAEFQGFSERELFEIARLSEDHLLREAIRIVLLERKKPQ